MKLTKTEKLLLKAIERIKKSNIKYYSSYGNGYQENSFDNCDLELQQWYAYYEKKKKIEEDKTKNEKLRQEKKQQLLRLAKELNVQILGVIR